MSTVFWDKDRPFPLVLHVKRGAEIRRYVPERVATVEVSHGDHGPEDGVDRTEGEYYARLADLIEPTPTSSDKAPTCDRDALLALASGLEADADRIIRAARNARFGGGPRMGEAKHDAYEWRSIARCIRKALGVEK